MQDYIKPFSIRNIFAVSRDTAHLFSTTRTEVVPIYILLLFAIVSVLLGYMVFHWIWSVLPISNRNESRVEGFANPKYTYKPNSDSPNLSITFGLSDLAIDISAACGFIKVDSKLIKIGGTSTSAGSSTSETQSPSTSETQSPSPNATNTTMTPAPYSGSDKRESFADEESTKTEPTSSTKTEPTSSTTEPEPESTPSSTSTSTQPPYPTAAPIETTDSDYTVPYTELQIYKMYNTATGYSSTSNTNIYKMMDASYSNLFDSSQLSEMPDESIEKLWNSVTGNVIDDAIYNGTSFFAIQSEMSNRQCTKSGLSDYFVSQIQKNKTRSSILLSLKNAYYAIIKPRFLINTLSNIYWENAKSITNSDKGTFNSIIFVLNTGGSLATTNTLETDLSENNVAKIISKDTKFTMDSLRLYQMMSVAFELYRFVAYFEKNGSVTSGNGTPAITTNVGKFISGFPKYLEKTSQLASDSPLVFLAKHLPYDTKCEIMSNLGPYINNLK